MLLTKHMKTFNYTPGSPLMSKLSTLGIALFMIVFPLVAPFGIRIGSMRILGPTAVTVIFVVGGLALLVMTLLEIRKARVLAAKGGTITVDGDVVTYPAVKKGEIETRSFKISEIGRIKYDEEDKECEVTLPDGSVTLNTNFFDSDEEYETFRALLGK